MRFGAKEKKKLGRKKKREFVTFNEDESHRISLTEKRGVFSQGGGRRRGGGGGRKLTFSFWAGDPRPKKRERTFLLVGKKRKRISTCSGDEGKRKNRPSVSKKEDHKKKEEKVLKEERTGGAQTKRSQGKSRPSPPL